jgi:hypothetical protein
VRLRQNHTPVEAAQPRSDAFGGGDLRFSVGGLLWRSPSAILERLIALSHRTF